MILRRLLAEVDANQAEQAAPEDGHDRENGAHLDHHFEGGGLGAFEAQQVADDDHVAGRGNGQKLGQALYYAQHEGDKQGVRLCHGSDLLVDWSG